MYNIPLEVRHLNPSANSPNRVKCHKIVMIYIFYILQHFTAELCNFTKHSMLFQAMVIFLPILNFFKFHVKGERSIHDPYFGTILCYLYQNAPPLPYIFHLSLCFSTSSPTHWHALSPIPYNLPQIFTPILSHIIPFLLSLLSPFPTHTSFIFYLAQFYTHCYPTYSYFHIIIQHNPPYSNLTQLTPTSILSYGPFPIYFHPHNGTHSNFTFFHFSYLSPLITLPATLLLQPPF